MLVPSSPETMAHKGPSTTLRPSHLTKPQSQDDGAAEAHESTADHVHTADRRLRVQAECARCQEYRAVAARNHVRNMIQKYNAASASAAALDKSTGKPSGVQKV